MTDKSREAFERFSSMLSDLEGRAIKLLSPFWNMTKADIVRWLLKEGYPKEILLKTVSCYSPENTRYCGACASCFRKWAALWSGGIKLSFSSKEVMQDYEQRCLSGRYDPDRNKDTLQAIREWQDENSHRH